MFSQDHIIDQFSVETIYIPLSGDEQSTPNAIDLEWSDITKFASNKDGLQVSHSDKNKSRLHNIDLHGKLIIFDSSRYI